jgi:hypothetical protein
MLAGWPCAQHHPGSPHQMGMTARRLLTYLLVYYASL